LATNGELSYNIALDLEEGPQDEKYTSGSVWLSEQSISSSSSESLSSDSFFSSDSNSLSSSNSQLSTTASDSLEGTDHSDEEHAAGITVIGDLLQLITETCILNPNWFAKCSQLYLILINFKQDDLKEFHLNLCVSPDTFDGLVKMIEDHHVFTNKSYISQTLVSEQLAMALS
jgi:hypothetical protein